MFTGLVERIGRVADVSTSEAGAVFTIEANLESDVCDGDSIAVDGVCLTARNVQHGTPGTFKADVMQETLRRSTLGDLVVSDSVNLEQSLRASDRLGGHIVQGHVDGTGTVLGLDAEGFARVLTIAIGEGLERYVVEKGSVAVSGVSLTVASIGQGSFTVSLIPETLERTTLGSLKPNDSVNLEVDVLAKHVEKLIAHRQ